jgi:hypothetical protein
MPVKARLEFPRPRIHEHDCGAFRDANDPAQPAVNADDIVD